MSCLGVYYAITPERAHRLLTASSNAEHLAVVDEIERERWGDPACALYRCRPDGTPDPVAPPIAATLDDVKKALGAALPGDRFVLEPPEPPLDGAAYPWACGVDKAWDAIHRCLTDGTLDPGEGPLAKFVLGGKSLYDGMEHILCLVSPEEAREAAEAAASLDEAWLRHRYFGLRSEDVGYTIGETDFQYTWEYLRLLPPFFARAADAGRWVLFTADQ